MTNPFENEQGTYVVLMNEEGQYSLWPAFVHIPAGWEIVCGETSRSACIDYISSNWTDLSPNSLKPAAEVHGGQQ
ncbi:MbtH family protein [Bacillus paralicheniformis]|jgi:MbtH protein|uniref:Enterobactin biosynthesis protein YbdZ n=1 Tax=Bacillus paralicheniformis TaxID=1648923 RepID=A0A6I7TP31_9BACI|nr:MULTISPECIES: MbtH family protein [Bacillus]ETB70468.1 protein mbtH [Bacillus sp. CPSM8]KJD55703.1 protein mbtH [Bacillus amyloliquefaciens]KUL06377.1 protein mbtH [Bacillus licheniformis LMG 7559]KUL18012.1 protein mbtH [Bacillus licheniformis LMG 6934]MBC8621643.1 MbtH family protein [Robertmurraya crescens]POO81533.1 MbtH family protein [Bacillus sp. MBGLi97]